MKLIEPQAIRLLSSTVPENDAPAWNAGTAYEIGDSVIHEHRVYKAVTASTGKRPDQNCEGTDAAWRLMGPTNRYAMLDQYVSTQTVAPMDAETLTFTVTFNRCTAFALLNFKATSIRAVVKDGDGLVMYDRTVNTLKDVDGYWNYYFLPLERIVDQAVTNIPMSPVATLYVSLTQEGGPALGRSSRGRRGLSVRRSTIPGSASGTIPERTPTSSATRGWSSGPTPSARACPCTCTRPGWTACGKSSPGCTAFPRCGSGTTTRASAPTSR